LAIDIKELRGRTGLSQTKFALLLGASVASLRRWEAGDATPSPLALIRIKEIANLTDETLTELCSNIQMHNEPMSYDSYKTNFNWKGNSYKAYWAPYVINGPIDQVEFYKKLVELQQEAKFDLPPKDYFRRLSLLRSVDDVETNQYKTEKPKASAKSWSSDYGTHGFHRYVGRFPSHLVRALINYCSATSEDIILDPFCGSGTTLVEARMLGINAMGIEISPLSAMITRVKSQFPEKGLFVSHTISELTDFYNSRWDSFLQGRSFSEITFDSLINRPGNHIKPFSNIERWFSKDAFLGTSIIVEFIMLQSGYLKDFLTIALSAKMRSIGNVDVDVVRAEYRKVPRNNVDVLKLVKAQIHKMASGISNTINSSSKELKSSTTVEVIEGSVLTAKIKANSISHIITSPPYGVESLSYLRTHLLSFRVLEPILGIDPYNFCEDVIGSEFLMDDAPDVSTFKVNKASATYNSYFYDLLKKNNSTVEQKRVLMMMKFFEDMYSTIERFSIWLKEGGRVVFIIGNKKIGDSIIPTDIIIGEIFNYFDFALEDSIQHKLKTNNSNSQVPWQERIIENEYILLFRKGTE
jgi:tRNA G10  N-methylase Trm11/transcriptional regulator with XRE-family HTH domain